MEIGNTIKNWRHRVILGKQIRGSHFLRVLSNLEIAPRGLLGSVFQGGISTHWTAAV